jgi:hypothetical protein
MEGARMKNFFISYTSEDFGFTEWLTGRLADKEITHWFDQNLLGGFTPYHEIDQNLEAATDLILVLSQNTITSQRARTELFTAIMAGKRVTLLELEPVSLPTSWSMLTESDQVRVIQAGRKLDVDAIVADMLPPAPPSIDKEIEDEVVFRDVTPKDDPGVQEKMGGGAEPVRFTTYHPARVAPGKWHKLLAYIHLPKVADEIHTDSRKELGPEAPNYGKGRDTATETILREAEISVVPEMPGVRFNPPQHTILWLEDWHRADFRMQANPADPEFEVENTVFGKVRFYVGPILVAETNMATYITEEGHESPVAQPQTEVSADPYRDIFVSYSHKDDTLVALVEKHIETLGDQMVRDVHDLRSGEEWNPRLLELIEAADIFQLFWSHSAKASEYVEQEWRHALSMNRKHFIRPVFWEDPMPKPPDELGHIHFDELVVKGGE